MGINQYQFRFDMGRSGFGIIETVVSMLILSIIAIGAAYFTANNRSMAIELSSSTSCTTIVNGIASQIKAHDNSLVVRNWIQSESTPLRYAASESDPYCNGSEGRTAICDTLRLVQNAERGTVARNNYTTHQNIRGAHTWAQNLYNSAGSGICHVDGDGRPLGLRMSAEALKNALPSSDFEIPNWLTETYLYIQPQNIACGTPSTRRDAVFDIRIIAKYTDRQTGTPNGQACSTDLTIAAPQDSVKPRLTISQVVNGNGQVIGDNRCTDPREVTDILRDGAGTAWQNISVRLLASEPGVVFICRREGPYAPNAPEDYFNCPDFPMGGVNVFNPGPTTVTFNIPSPSPATYTMANMPDTGGMETNNRHRYTIRAVDVGGNESDPVTTTSFYVHSPSCPFPTSSYCPNAQLNWLPPLWDPWTATGNPGSISIRPWDNCLNGGCPQGTHSVCDGAIAGNFCVGTSYPDDCGELVCPGTMPQLCVGTERANTDCNEPAVGQCGMNCGLGTRPTCKHAPPANTIECMDPVPAGPNGCGADCGVGTMNCPTPAPATPVPATPCPICGACAGDCSADDPSTRECNTFGADACGTPDVCAVAGTMNCPDPTPTPTPAAIAPWEMSERLIGGCERFGHGDTRNCPIRFDGFPTGYTWCSVSTRLLGHRHGGSGMQLHVQMRGGPGYNTWLSPMVRGGGLGRELGGSEAGHPDYHQAWSVTTVQTHSAGAGASASFNIFVDDARADLLISARCWND